MIHIHTLISNAMASAHLDTEGYELSIPGWSGRQADVEYLTQLATFVGLVKTVYLEVLEKKAVPVEPENVTTHYFMTHKPQPSPSSTARAVDEILQEEEYDFPMFDIIEDDLPSRIDAFEAAHPECIPGDLSWLNEDEGVTGEKGPDDSGLEGVQGPDAWIDPATDEELASQSDNSGDLFEDDGGWDDEDGFWQDGYYYRY